MTRTSVYARRRVVEEGSTPGEGNLNPTGPQHVVGTSLRFVDIERMAAFAPDGSLLNVNTTHAYPPSRDRPDPKQNGSDLIGRVFLEPEIGVCLITGLGPVVRHQLATRAQLRRQKKHDEPLLSQGTHCTLSYTQTLS